jgi:hypothetical protein
MLIASDLFVGVVDCEPPGILGGTPGFDAHLESLSGVSQKLATGLVVECVGHDNHDVGDSIVLR